MAINIKNQIYSSYKNSTYQMKVDEQNMLIHTYYGNRTDDTDCSYLIRMADRGFSGNILGLTESVYILWIFFRRSFRYMATETIV